EIRGRIDRLNLCWNPELVEVEIRCSRNGIFRVLASKAISNIHHQRWRENYGISDGTVQILVANDQPLTPGETFRSADERIVLAPGSCRRDAPLEDTSGPIQRVLLQAIVQARIQAVPAEVLSAPEVIVVSLIDVQGRIVRQRIVTEHLQNVRIGIGDNRIRNRCPLIHVRLQLNDIEGIVYLQWHGRAAHVDDSLAEISLTLERGR